MKFDKYVFILIIFFLLTFASNYMVLSLPKQMGNEEFSKELAKIAEEEGIDVDKVVVGDKGIESITYNDTETKDVEETKEDRDSTSPQAPTGFSWQKCTGMRAEFLMPNGWHFREDTSDTGNQACFVSKEQITSTEGFETGLSVNAIKNISDSTPTAPMAFMETYMEEIATYFDKVEPFDTLEASNTPFLGLATTMSKEDITVYYLLYYNTKSDTLYVVSFESPNEQWAESWKIGKVMLEKLGFSASF